ncbi:MAG: VF530 family DNA-binding protein [Elusimicrobia bacterium]|nr:VF530 family DNA-binding protein [Elusimicrobiota bacterium]
MFGGYTIYCDGKVVALVCNNQLFIKPTVSGRAFVGKVVESPPYPGAKLYFFIEDKFEDRKWISDLIRITAKELSVPAAKIKSKDPLHGITLEMILNMLVDRYGWDGLGRTIKINCFNHDPSIKSSLKFLRKTPWARKKVETLYLKYKKNK